MISTGKNMHLRIKDMQKMIALHQYLVKSALTGVEFERIKVDFDVSRRIP